MPAPDDPVALEVTVLDGDLGVPLRGASVTYQRRGSSRRGDAGPPLSSPDGLLHRLDDSGLLRRATGGFSLHVRPPTGFVLERGNANLLDSSSAYSSDGIRVRPFVTAFTRLLRVTVVAWPEARIRVSVVDHEGRPFAGAHLWARRVGTEDADDGTGRLLSRHYPGVGKGTTGPDGTGELRGVPCIRGDRIQVWASEVCSEPILLERSSSPIEVDLRLPPPSSGVGVSIGGGGQSFG